jgi:hypothetical protein
MNNSGRIMGDSSPATRDPVNRLAERLRRQEEVQSAEERVVAAPDPEEQPWTEAAWIEPVEPPRRRWGLLAFRALLAVSALSWMAFASWLVLTGQNLSDISPVMTSIAAALTPLLLILVIWLVAGRHAEDPTERLSAWSGALASETQASLNLIEEAEKRLQAAAGALRRHSQEAATLTEASASSLLASASRIEEVSGRITPGLKASSETAGEALALIDALEKAAPQLDSRLSNFARSLVQCGEDLASRGATLDEQIRTAALVAEEARLQITQAHDAALNQVASLRSEARQTSDELASMAELASARIDFTLERTRSAAAEAREKLETHSAALDTLIARGRGEIAAIAGEGVSTFADQVDMISRRISETDRTIAGHGERGAAMLASLAMDVEEAGEKFAALEREAEGRNSRLSQGLGELGEEARRLEMLLSQGSETTALFHSRAESLLLAVESGIRELDESLPASFDRTDARLAETQSRLTQAMNAVADMQAPAGALLERLEQAQAGISNQSVAITQALGAGDAGLERQKAELATIQAALDENRRLMGELLEHTGPRLTEALQHVRDEANAVAAQARQTIEAAIGGAAGQLEQASGAALEAAISRQVNAQLGQIAEIADNAVKSAHRATDHLLRQMMTLSDSAADLESRIESANAADQSRNRNFLTERSAQIIASLQDSAIDVSKWLGADVGERDWSAYLAGDKSLFTRRAVKLLTSSEARRIHASYEADLDFQEQVNRYVTEFEAMLSDILAGRNGNSLAIALLSSDVGKLYVGLAQAINRIRGA